jgi:hypothetical protein
MSKPLAQRLADGLSAIFPGFETTQAKAHKEAATAALTALAKLAAKSHHGRAAFDSLNRCKNVLKEHGVSL